MPNTGHAESTIPEAKVAVRTRTSLVYRKFLGADYLIPKTHKLINVDLNEPL